MTTFQVDKPSFIIGKWTALCLLNAVLSFVLALSVISGQETVGIIAMAVALVILIAIMSAIEMSLRRHGELTWVQTLTVGAIIKCLLQFTVMLDMLIGVITVSLVDSVTKLSNVNVLNTSLADNSLLGEALFGLTIGLMTLFDAFLSVFAALILGGLAIGVWRLCRPNKTAGANMKASTPLG